MRVESKSARYPGYVIIPDELTFPQAIAWEDAVDQAAAATKSFARSRAYVPAVMACVTEWHVEGLPQPVTFDNFPASPAGAIQKLLQPIVSAVTGLLFGEDEAKNA